MNPVYNPDWGVDSRWIQNMTYPIHKDIGNPDSNPLQSGFKSGLSESTSKSGFKSGLSESGFKSGCGGGFEVDLKVDW